MNAPYRQSLTDRELRWLRHIAVHGPQSSEFLLEAVSDTHRCRDTGLRTLQKMRETGYLRLPPQQRQIAKADFNPYVYDLTPLSERYLRGIGDPATVRPTGHWWHAFLTASITSAIAIEANRRGYQFIEAHEILGRNGASLAIPTRNGKLIPDQLFAIDYGGRFRSFVLEVDRGTEPYRSETSKKSLRRMFQLYDEIWALDGARTHYGLKSPVLILMAFTSPARAARCLELVAMKTAKLAPFVLLQVVPDGFPRYSSLSSSIAGKWRRQDNSGVGVIDDT